MAHLSIAKPTEHTEIIKNSRFIVWVSALEQEENSETQITRVRSRYPDANHHCYAYKQGQNMRSSDDGEPGGTAGRPMLEVLQKRNLDHCLAVITRYFGGTKLGAGGLIRAYSGSLAKALDQAGIIEIKDRVNLHLEIPFAQMDSLHRYLDKVPTLTKEATEYTETGLKLSINLLQEDEEKLKKELIDLTRGDLQWLNEL